jgi:hypothetical protein
MKELINIVTPLAKSETSISFNVLISVTDMIPWTSVDVKTVVSILFKENFLLLF